MSNKSKPLWFNKTVAWIVGTWVACTCTISLANRILRMSDQVLKPTVNHASLLLDKTEDMDECHLQTCPVFCVNGGWKDAGAELVYFSARLTSATIFLLICVGVWFKMRWQALLHEAFRIIWYSCRRSLSCVSLCWSSMKTLLLQSLAPIWESMTLLLC